MRLQKHSGTSVSMLMLPPRQPVKRPGLNYRNRSVKSAIYMALFFASLACLRHTWVSYFRIKKNVTMQLHSPQLGGSFIKKLLNITRKEKPNHFPFAGLVWNIFMRTPSKTVSADRGGKLIEICFNQEYLFS